MREAVIVEAIRTPIARGKMGKGGLSGIHPAKLLATVQQAVVDRAGYTELWMVGMPSYTTELQP